MEANLRVAEAEHGVVLVARLRPFPMLIIAMTWHCTCASVVSRFWHTYRIITHELSLFSSLELMVLFSSFLRMLWSAVRRVISSEPRSQEQYFCALSEKHLDEWQGVHHCKSQSSWSLCHLDLHTYFRFVVGRVRVGRLPEVRH